VTVGETGFSTPGNYSATTTLALNSNAVNGSGLGQTGIPSQVITVTDNVYSGQSTWTTTTSGGTWGTLSTSFGTNWGANQGSPGVDSNFTNTDTATFGAISGQPTEAVTLDTAAPSLLGITFSGGATTSYTISEGSSTNALTLSGSGAIITDTGGTNTIAVPLVLSSNVAAKVSGGGNLIISGNITGAGTFALTSNGTTGTVTLSGSNISTTPFTVNADTLSAVNLASFGSNATVSLSNGGTLQYTGSAATGSAASTMGRNITVGGGTTGVLSNTGSGVETLSGGTVTNNAASTLNFSGGEFVVGEAIGGGSATSNVKVIGGSTVGLTASNTYLGSTSISGGSVLLTSAGALPTSTNSAVILGSGTDTGGQTNTLDLVGTSQTVASITNTGLATNQIISSNGSNGSGNNTPGSGSGASSVTGVLTVNNSSADTYSGSLGGSGSATNFSLTKSGTGALTLSGANTYTGGTTVAAGTLLADAVGATGTGAVTVNSGGVLGGTGTITSTGITVASGGLLNPSGGTGSPSHLTLALNSGSLTMNSGSNLAFVLGSTSSSDEVLVSSGTVALNNQNFSNFAFTTTTGFGTGNYILITDTGSDTNAITGLSGTGLTGSITGGFSGTLTLINSQQTLELVVSSTVPEPSTWALMIGGFAVLMVFQIRRRRS
jgi:fibronectin-binding autotransporter adhesin